MTKLKRRYTQSRFELASIIFALYEHWVSHKYSKNVFGKSAGGFKGLDLFFKESINVIKSYKSCIIKHFVGVYTVSDNVVLTEVALKHGRCDLRRSYGFNRITKTEGKN